MRSVTFNGGAMESRASSEALAETATDPADGPGAGADVRRVLLRAFGTVGAVAGGALLVALALGGGWVLLALAAIGSTAAGAAWAAGWAAR